MTLQFDSTALYIRYLIKRDGMDTYYCKYPFRNFENAYYKCEKINEDYMRVYRTYEGESVPIDLFRITFRKHSKLRQFINEFFSL